MTNYFYPDLRLANITQAQSERRGKQRGLSQHLLFESKKCPLGLNQIKEMRKIQSSNPLTNFKKEKTGSSPALLLLMNGLKPTFRVNLKSTRHFLLSLHADALFPAKLSLELSLP